LGVALLSFEKKTEQKVIKQVSFGLVISYRKTMVIIQHTDTTSGDNPIIYIFIKFTNISTVK